MTKSASRAARGPASPAATSSEPFDDGVAVAVALRGVSLFAGIDPDTFGWLRHRAVLERLPAGTRLSGHGDPQLHVAAIVSGSIEMGLIAPNGRQTLVSYLGPGQVIGLIAVFDGRGVVYDSQVSETCTLVRIAATDFREAVDRSKVLRDRVLRMLASRSRMLLEATADFHTQPLPVRLARVLLSLGSAHGVTVPEQGVDIELKVSQERLARMLNVSRQRVNLELAALEAKGLVQRGGYRRINLLDREALGRVAWSNPG